VWVIMMSPPRLVKAGVKLGNLPGSGQGCARVNCRFLWSLPKSRLAVNKTTLFFRFSEGDPVKSKMMVLAIAVYAVAIAMSAAENPNMGTWKLNEAKSKFSPGAMKNSTVVYQAAGDSVKVTTDGTSGDGKPVHTEWTGKFDGKDYPLTGDGAADTRAYTQVSPHLTTFANKKGGKVTVSGKIVVSADGKSRTVTVSGTDSSGKEASSRAVYDKQ